jgi:hypothetical protein
LDGDTWSADAWLLGSGIDPHPDVLDIHPRWRVGQYVSYFLERGDGSWTAFTIRIVNRPDDGAWVLIADFKTASGESTAWFGSNPQATAEVVDPVPLQQQMVRGSSASTPQALANDPGMASSMAMNLLLVWHFPGAAEAFKAPPRSVRHRTGIPYRDGGTRIHEAP